MLLIFTFVTHTHYVRQRIHQDNSLWVTLLAQVMPSVAQVMP